MTDDTSNGSRILLITRPSSKTVAWIVVRVAGSIAALVTV